MTSVVSAQVDFETLEGVAAPRLAGDTLSHLFSNQGGIISYFFFFSGAAVLIYFVLGGFQFLMSRGDPKAVAQAQGKLTNAIIGFIIVFTAFWIVQVIGLVLGLEGITEVFG